MTATTVSMTLDQAMARSLTDPLTAVAEALDAHRWALAHLLVVRHVPLGERREAFERLTTMVTDPLGQRLLLAVRGKTLSERAKERWTVSPLAHVGYFKGLAPHYARLAALLAIGAGEPSWGWAERLGWLNLAVADGLALHDAPTVRALVLEAARCPHPEVWAWLHAHGLLAPHAAALRAELRERLSPDQNLVERFLPASAGARPHDARARDAGLPDGGLGESLARVWGVHTV